jgi:hypothetical protein
MDELVINLDPHQKFPKRGWIFNSITGAAFIVTAVSAIVVKIIVGQGFWDYFFFILLFVFGVTMLLYTFGVFYRITRRYVILNQNGIEYKMSYYYPSRIVRWDDLRKVEIKTLRIIFYSVKGSVWRMKLGEISYNEIKTFKKALAEFCTEKGIGWTDSTVGADPDWVI